MKWLTLAGILLYLTRHGDAAALKCSPENQNPLCASEKRDLSPSQSPDADAECLAGSEWESNCHYCRCSDSGVAECLKQNTCDLQVFEEPVKCKPNTTFQRDCNTCTCLENGLGLCTLMGCIHFPVPDTNDRKRRQAPQKMCEPGASWAEDCNTCRCTSNGIPACTRKGCHPPSSINKRDTTSLVHKQNPISTDHMIVKRGICKSNQEFQVDCNPCKCAANGQSYTCTHNECLEGDNNMNKEVEVFMESEGSDHIERHSVCKPRDTFYIGCNPCHCNAYGTDYTCSNKPCPLPKDVEIFHELNENTTKSSNITKRVVCVANRMFIMDCNTCWCNEDGTSFFCTRRICTPDSPDENITGDPELTENSTVVRKARASQSEPPKTCQPGTEFRMDCNKCLCNDEGRDFSCTRIDCAAQNGNGEVDTFAGTRSKRDLSEQVEMECVPGSVFDRECNPCRCTTDGKHAVCSMKRCKQDKPEPSTDPTTQSFRCTPGDQFKRDCQDCTCSADGKTFFCTLQLCDQELTGI